jgi:hypothetical protein
MYPMAMWRHCLYSPGARARQYIRHLRTGTEADMLILSRRIGEIIRIGLPCGLRLSRDLINHRFHDQAE